MGVIFRRFGIVIMDREKQASVKISDI
jgi:hypothetical protein